MELSRILIAFAIIVLPFAALASAGDSGANTVVITKADDGREIGVQQGAIIEVRLEQSAGTGYLWQIIDPDIAHLKVLESTDTQLRQIPGGTLLKTWRIEAAKQGQTELKMLLYRPWEGIEKAVDRLQVKILIRLSAVAVSMSAGFTRGH